MVDSYVVIPARGGSKGIKGKNLINIRGKSLTLRSMIHAKNLVNDQNIILSTDSEEIVADIANFFKISEFDLKTNQICDFGPYKLNFRDHALSTDEALITDVLFSIRNSLLNLGYSIDLVCLLQPTSPYRSFNELIKLKEFMDTNGNKQTSLVSVCLVEDMHPARMYSKLNGGFLKELEGFTEFRAFRRQDLPEIFIRDGGYYVIGDELISKKLQYSQQPMSFERKFPWTINIDSAADLLLAQYVEEIDLNQDPNESYS